MAISVNARRLGLRPIGVSFHVGSQQNEPQAWSAAIAHAAWVFRACAHRGVDLASLGEIDVCLDLHIPPSRLSFGNTVKREAAIARAAYDGIGLFAFDSAAELEKLAR